MLWDFGGHGAKQERCVFPQQNLDIADAALRSQPEVDPSRLGCWVIQWVVAR